ncbi:hypothetical protein K443DRAFT_683936 [Laccaria amethystina LaAM-08-1]|uniref:Unplaced genomic scaffold K443scaffold_269, whole genome shotgun sequence n=1 Tax=Laccaria amethystina LaAM-08-1 TaxID=1095629 RepID=A0A0C9X954_9AGAR|nr:hypothetical protein K443DRAFT_683936 [Laccaria amethystina LaAM-08-1]
MPLNTPTSNSVEEKVQNHIFNTVNDHWGISQFSKNSLPLSISHIHFIAHPNEDNSGSDGQQPTNHWTMYLETSPNSSVHVDVVLDDNDVAMVMLETEQVNYDAYNVFHKSLPVIGEGCSVATVLDVLITKKRDVYRFTPVGEGCRYWLSIVVLDLVDAGLVNREDAQDAIDGLGMYWCFPPGAGSFAREIARGSF